MIESAWKSMRTHLDRVSDQNAQEKSHPSESVSFFLIVFVVFTEQTRVHALLTEEFTTSVDLETNRDRTPEAEQLSIASRI